MLNKLEMIDYKQNNMDVLEIIVINFRITKNSTSYNLIIIIINIINNFLQKIVKIIVITKIVKTAVFAAVIQVRINSKNKII